MPIFCFIIYKLLTWEHGDCDYPKARAIEMGSISPIMGGDNGVSEYPLTFKTSFSACNITL